MAKNIKDQISKSNVKEFVEHLYPLLEAEPIFSDYKVIRSIKRY